MLKKMQRMQCKRTTQSSWKLRTLFETVARCLVGRPCTNTCTAFKCSRCKRKHWVGIRRENKEIPFSYLKPPEKISSFERQWASGSKASTERVLSRALIWPPGPASGLVYARVRPEIYESDCMQSGGHLQNMNSMHGCTDAPLPTTFSTSYSICSIES